MPRRVAPPSLADAIYRQLKEDIFEFRLLPGDPARLVVIPRGIDPAAFPRARAPDRAARAQVAALHPQLGGEGPLLLLPGRGTRLKGHADAIELLAALRADGVDARLWMPGALQAGREAYIAGLMAQARAAVAATRYPPAGVRGLSVSQRNNRYGTVKDYFKIVNDNIAVMVQIETMTAVEAVEEICQVPGVDGVFIGPGDLSTTMGHIGNPLHPEVQAAMQKVFAGARAHGKPVGILAPVEADARRYMEMGASFVAVGSDLGVFRAASQALRDKFR